MPGFTKNGLFQVQVPSFDGQRNSFLNYEEKVLLRQDISPSDPGKKAAHLLLHMADVARKVCLTVGKDVIGNQDGVAQILNILRVRFAPDMVDCIFQDITKFMYFKRTTQEMDVYLLEFDILRQKAESRMSMGAGFPDEYVSVLCLQNANLSKNERQLVMARVGSAFNFTTVTAQMRRLFGNVGSTANQDALVMEDAISESEEDDAEILAAYRKAKKTKKDGETGGSRRSTTTPGRVKNAVNRRTGETNRCFVRNSEYHYAPQCPKR